MNIHYFLSPIGIIHSPFDDPAHTPIQAVRSQAIGQVEIDPKYILGLTDLEEFSHIYLFYYFHKSNGYSLKVQPFLDDQERGVFATRHPRRPNPLGFSIVRLLSIKENILTVEGIDVLDGTPLLDIKPYVPDFDQRGNVLTGWYSRLS
jgi:tRNA-Thr(GGU) m(6)t(6)A37 methyltransferase TsaA